jgi:hypothetical protein
VMVGRAPPPSRGRRSSTATAASSDTFNSFKEHHRTLTSSFRYTLSLLGAVRAVFLFRPPALRSMPCGWSDEVI